VPFYTFTWPAAARALLMYRFHTLPAARAKAVHLGYRGALYAWESADTGDETTPDVIMDTTGRVLEVPNGRLEQHISADIAYAVWRYWQATADDSFMLEAGAEIVLETARFWASRAGLEADGRYHIRCVVGPDEYHERIDDNAFTNNMAIWNLERGLELGSLLRFNWPERWAVLSVQLGLTDAELEQWRDVAARLATGFDPHTGLLEQFGGYFGLEEVDLRQYEGRTAPMDVVLGRERTQHSQVIKQADVVALLTLLPERYEPDMHVANFHYYEPRCGHGSSLSRGMHAIVAARLGMIALAEQYFRDTAATDLDDRSGASNGGIRIAALGALWQAAVFGFSGFTPRADGIAFSPHLPPKWRTLQFRLQWRRRTIKVRLDQSRQSVTATLERGDPMTVTVGEEDHRLTPGAPVDALWSTSVAVP
jgi:trehalose/maltose hydrolase-like predicted phosphorylase